VIALEDVCIRAGGFALDAVSFQVPAGGYAVLMGRTGSGKTTILEAICGLNRPVRGRVLLGGRDVTGLRPADRQVGYVPQDRALFGTMTVAEHLAFGPTIRGWPRGEVAARVDELAGLLRLRHLLHRRPHGLSGGESQRVALGRAIAARPGVLLLDEPLSALDDQSRAEMYEVIRLVRSHSPVTTLHVTHHLEEAERLADQALVLEGGRVRPLGVAELRTGRGGSAERDKP
jgi:ABC-type sugar transport system ATPase subunit